MSSSRRLNSKLKASESNENSNQMPIDSVSSHVPRSPLLSIQVPTHIDVNAVKGGVLTPKSAQVRSNPKNSGFRASKRDKESSKCLEKVDVGCFELDADLKFWEDHNVQVLIRIRPITSMESAIHGHKRCLIQNSSQTLTWTGHPETRFTFDHVACEAVTQEKLFRAVGLPMVNNCMLGYNSCMFAYGQTGSGKTYTMMGEIQEINKQLSDDRGMTPRVFEYLFTRIKEEEECQSEEKLKYNCKCSFLEIYNEQIIDLLEPTSTNLQLREDIKKGVYVENLKEYEVSSVKDVMELLLQGATNRKMASTHMNSESSRSHSVFTCVIESRREIDSLTHIRFGRLNLVDLAGSERQKSSGAEGERLKEAANINRSLSTLGLVIMTLVDVANGKNRHVPYRDSRLTFLLQDSLGGNSKTTIIANVSPSICSASETLSTLKFAQRAKLIQNNAKVNEDSSGDVMALQSQIQTLKDQLAVLLKHQNIPRSFCYPSLCRDQTAYGDQCDDSHGSLLGNETPHSDSCSLKNESKQLEASLIDSLRREELTEAAMRRLEDEIKHLSRLVHQREDDTQRVKTLLRFREEKLRRLELLADDLVTTDGYLMEENLALTKEIQLLKETMDKNPELTHFALENKRLLEELRMYQNFYEQGERDALLAEVSYLRNQLLKVVDGKFFPVNKDSSQEDRPAPKANIENQITSSEQADSVPSIKLYEVQNELSDARLLIKELENQQAQLLVEFDKLKKENQKHTELSTIICTEMHIGEEPGSCPKVTEGPCNPAKFNHLNANELGFTAFGKEPDSNGLNCFSLAETRDEKLDSKSVYLIQENAKLSKLISKREEEMHSLSYEWEKAIVDLTTFLTDGWKSLDDASEYIESVVESLPLKSTYINEHVERAIKIFLEKEILILDLQRGLQEAQKKGKEMKQKLDSLRGATLAITGVQQLEYNEKSNELSTLRELLDEKNCVIHELESELKQKEEHIIEAVKVADASRKIITELYEMDYADLLNAGDIKSIIHELAIMHTNLPINDIILSEGRVCFQTNRMCPVGIDDALHDVQERTNHANELLIRFDAVQDTMEEAEHVLKSLLKANEVTKKEKDIIINKYVRFLKEISELISSLEESFQQIQRITHDGFNAICAGISSFQKEVNNTIFSSRLCIEDMISEATGKSFELFVLYQCHRGALHGQPIHSNSYSNTDHHKHNRFSSVIGNEDISDNYICSDAFKIQRKLSPAKISMQDMLHKAEDPIDASVVDCKNKMLSSTQHCSDARFLQLEKENLNLTNDIELLKTVISELVTGSVKLKDEWVPGENLMQDGTATSSDASMPDSNEECDHDRTVNIFHDIKSDAENILHDIQCLRTQFIQPNSSKLAEKDYMKYIEITNAKTEIGNQTMQAWNRLINKVNYLLPLIPTIVQSQLGKNPTNSLERSFVDICNIEVKVCNLLEKCHRYENTNQSVNEEMEQKDKLIKGLLFDISLLQESSFNAKSTKVELEEITADYNLVCQELKVRTTQMEALTSRLAEYESDLSNSRMELDKTHDTLIRLSDENKKLNLLLDDAHFKYCQNEELLEHKQKVIEGLQSDILAFNSSVEGKLMSSNEDIMKELIKVCNEKDGLQAEIANLTDRLEMASALADENEAVAIEARQVAETSKIYAEEKEEEVKVLEHSVEELEDTIDILEKKVYDMKVEVEEHHSMRKMLELEVQTLTQRMFRVENAAGNLIAEYSNIEGERCRIPRKLDDKIIELCEARQRIEDFELEKSYTEEEIKQYREYISELVLHSEAQSSLYKEKYKELEAMVSEVKHASSKPHDNQNGEKVERNASRTRGAGSPFRCISSLVQQMNLEKDKELSEARNRVEELEALAAHRQKEICMLNARLAAADSMTHDVIRDLMGVKLDMSNYANLIDQEQIQDILRKAQKQHEEAIAKEQEILDLREHISHLVEERESWIEEINQRKADVLANEVLVERLKHRERMLAAQNEMLKIDKVNLRKRIAKLDEKLIAIVGSQNMNGHGESSLKFKDGISTRAGNEDHLSRRLAQSDKLLSHVRTSMKKST